MKQKSEQGTASNPLKGDSSDNLPGLPGIGDKTSTKILTQYGTIESLVENVDTMTDPKLQNLIRSHSQDALRFKDLATIRTHIPLGDFEFALDYQKNGIDVTVASQLFERLEFRTLIKRISVGKSATSEPKSDADAPELSLDFGKPTEIDLPRTLSPLTSVLLEFDVPLDKADFLTSRLVSIGIALGDNVVLPTFGSIEKVTCTRDELAANAALKELLENERVPKIVHDKKLSEGALAEIGILLRGVTFDTLLAAYLINAGRSSYKLSDLVTDYAGVSAQDAAACRPEYLRMVQPALLKRMNDAGLTELHDKIELPLASVLAGIERAGVAVDAVWLGAVSQSMGRQIADLETAIYEKADGERFPIGSTKQLQTVLFEKLALPAGKKTKTGYSTDSEVLEMLSSQGYEIAGLITQWRELTKLKSTYADNLQLLVSKRDGRIHTSLNQTVAATGRLSSSNPNLQNIPVRTEVGREIRKSFIAGAGKVLLAADYSQIELRIFAHMTDDPELVRTFQADEDIHRRTASLIFNVDEKSVTTEQRRRAKTINFAVIYGMSDFRLAAEIGIDVSTANSWKKTYFAEYPGVAAFAATILEKARSAGYVQTLLGRRRYTPDINSRVFQFRQAAEREAVNMPVQGTAADIMKLAMIDVDRELKKADIDAVMTLQVHDELVFECAPDDLDRTAKLVAMSMENAYALKVRLKVELRQGHNWSDMTPMNNVLDGERVRLGY
jgi:DNA polymerase-1